MPGFNGIISFPFLDLPVFVLALDCFTETNGFYGIFSFLLISSCFTCSLQNSITACVKKNSLSHVEAFLSLHKTLEQKATTKYRHCKTM